MLTLWLLSRVLEDKPDFILQQDGAPAHFHCHVRGYPNQQLPQRWIGRPTPDDCTIITWPPRSPDLTPCDFY